MSSSIAIPTTPATTVEIDHRRHQPSKTIAGSSPSSYSSSPSRSSPTSNTPARASEATPDPGSAQKQKMLHQRRPSLLSSAISKQESTTINISDDPDGPPRLISYLSSSQGFAWNPEIFLPSSVDYDYVPLENRHEPVHEILLSEEEIKKMFPQ